MPYFPWLPLFLKSLSKRLQPPVRIAVGEEVHRVFSRVSYLVDTSENPVEAWLQSLEDHQLRRSGVCDSLSGRFLLIGTKIVVDYSNSFSNVFMVKLILDYAYILFSSESYSATLLFLNHWWGVMIWCFLFVSISNILIDFFFFSNSFVFDFII